MSLKRQQRTSDNRLMITTLNSLKNRFGSPSTKQRLNLDNGSMVNGTEVDRYEKLATKQLDDQRSYETLKNCLNPHVNRLVTSEIKSIETRLATITAIKRLNSHRPIVKPHDNESCFDHDQMVSISQPDDGSIVNGTEFNHHEQIAINQPDDQRNYETLNNQLTTPDNRLITSNNKSIENRLATPSAIKRSNEYKICLRTVSTIVS